VTAAVRVTGWPTTCGLALVASEAVVPACWTTSTKIFEVAGALLASPAYVTVSVWVPTVSVEVENEKVTEPLGSAFCVAIAVTPSSRVSAPVGVTPLLERTPVRLMAMPGLTGEAGPVRVRAAVPREMVSTSGADVLVV